ncbi:LYR motif containing protein 1 isoform X2 [Polypterus senegalus]|uniref:LYR motif containing protein 1 isoform X2 n=1 Tax=Polypterus senegalus TaxID=55291 RepID=UPI001964AE0A|nr:LYR motif containing protein 1 isoform X2 [Polypterus senegalus]
MSGATRQEVLGLYRKVLRIARRWQSQSGLDKDSDVERKYICQEARNLFKQNRNITDPQLIKNCIEECNARIEIDAPPSNGPGHAERTPTTQAGGTEEAGKAHLPAVSP